MVCIYLVTVQKNFNARNNQMRMKWLNNYIFYYLLPPIFMISYHQSHCIQFETSSYSIFFTVMAYFLCASQCNSKVLNSHSQRDSSFCLSKSKPSFLGSTVIQSNNTKEQSVLIYWREKASYKCFSLSGDKCACVKEDSHYAWRQFLS